MKTKNKVKMVSAVGQGMLADVLVAVSTISLRSGSLLLSAAQIVLNCAQHVSRKSDDAFDAAYAEVSKAQNQDPAE